MLLMVSRFACVVLQCEISSVCENRQESSDRRLGLFVSSIVRTKSHNSHRRISNNNNRFVSFTVSRDRLNAKFRPKLYKIRIGGVAAQKEEPAQLAQTRAKVRSNPAPRPALVGAFFFHPVRVLSDRGRWRKIERIKSKLRSFASWSRARPCHITNSSAKRSNYYRFGIFDRGLFVLLFVCKIIVVWPRHVSWRTHWLLKSESKASSNANIWNEAKTTDECTHT